MTKRQQTAETKALIEMVRKFQEDNSTIGQAARDYMESKIDLAAFAKIARGW